MRTARRVARSAALALVVAACGLDAVGVGVDGVGEPGSSSGAPGNDASEAANVESGGGTEIDGAADGDGAPVTCDADTSTSLDHCGACFAACPAGSESCSGGRCLATLRIRVGIDGQSYFWFKGAQAQWHQQTYAAPARHPDTPLPLELNGQTFNPTWPDGDGDTQNYSCNCNSSFMNVPSPQLPAKAQTVGLQVVVARKSISIAEQPAASNGYRLSVLFDDVGFGGSSYYEGVLTYETR